MSFCFQRKQSLLQRGPDRVHDRLSSFWLAPHLNSIQRFPCFGQQYVRSRFHIWPKVQSCHCSSSSNYTSFVDWPFPFPKLRDKVLRRNEDFDEDDLCNGLVEVCQNTGERSNLIFWSNPWDPISWEVTTDFPNNLTWVLRWCEDVLVPTNYRRKRRGEEEVSFALCHYTFKAGTYWVQSMLSWR